MANQGPGRAERIGISLPQLFGMFPDDAAAEAWFEAQRWPDGRFCPDCGSTRTAAVPRRRPMPYRCGDCRAYFSVRKGTVMQSSKLGLQKWVVAIYLMTTGLKGTSSMELHRAIGVRQATAWHMQQRIRAAMAAGDGQPLRGPVEVDETFVGGKEANKHESQRARTGPTPKVAVIGVKDRATGAVRAKVIGQTPGPVLRGFVRAHAAPGAHVYSDGQGAYRALDGEFDHRAVEHGAGTYVIEQTHTNGIEAFWSMLKRGLMGTYHHVSAKHLQRYVDEFTGRHNDRPRDTIDQMASIARGMVGRRLTYRELVG